jgi:GH15 family glucan-1,4-alpha-glucosidase
LSALHQSYQRPWAELAHHSAGVLYALTFQPTGAIVAAPTTSLPESVGGPRNWDYRYTWVRDASLTLEALWVAACPDEVYRFFGWMAGAVAAQLHERADLQIMFGVGGEHDLSERTLEHLSGWRGSRPVRVGNGAWNQRQLDVYGELLSAVRRLADQVGRFHPTARRFIIAAADTAAARWQEKDQGIWEIRGAPRDFLYSKLMCWVALDSAISLADQLGARAKVPAWNATREEIRRTILERGWSERAWAFTQAFGSAGLDASALMLPIVGFLPGDDPRVRATIQAIAEQLTDEHGLVYRYRAHDGLEGHEGTFLLCTFWLAHAQALAGEFKQARATFERATAYLNRCWAALGGGGHGDWRIAWQFSSSVQSYRSSDRRLGYRPGRGRLSSADIGAPGEPSGIVSRLTVLGWYVCQTPSKETTKNARHSNWFEPAPVPGPDRRSAS